MKVMVFVDGENFRKTIDTLYTDFSQKDYLPKGARWADFFDEVVRQATGGNGTRIRTYWYVVGGVAPQPRKIPNTNNSQVNKDTIQSWFDKNSRYFSEQLNKDGFTDQQKQIDELIQRRNNIQRRFEGFRIIQNGIANKHRSIEFRRSGEISYDLARKKLQREKTVDVNLAVDMLRLSANYDLALLISGDQDYVPAVQAIKNMGKQVVNVAFKQRSGGLLPGGAKRLNDMTDWSYAVEWEQLRHFLELDKKNEQN